MVERLLIGLLTGGHVLLEGVPGLAKTLTVNTLAATRSRRSFQRIQFTPDLLPADLIGTLIYNPQHRRVHPQEGPVFANLVLADEINRAPAKVQSALLEAMQERQVTIGDTTYPLPDPFLVMATQNPIEQEGTYPLPEAQVDRFMLLVKVGYPTREEERAIMDRQTGHDAGPTVRRRSPRTSRSCQARAVVPEIYVDDKVKDYIVSHRVRDPRARSRSTRRGWPTTSSWARTRRSSRAAASPSTRCGCTSPATTSASSTGTSPPARAPPT
jgi:MoxR-like ATPase